MHLYWINANYIDYLSEFDKNVCFHKRGRRPYLGIIYQYQHYNYFAPLSSDGPNKQYLRKNLYRRIVIDIGKASGEQLGFVRINNMIPIPRSCYRKVDLKNVKNKEYRTLMLKQYQVFTTDLFKNELKDKVDRVYQISQKPSHFLKPYICDFKTLEGKCDEWKAF